MRSTSRRQHGFTLIELMITIVVLGILVTVAMPAYDGYVRKGNRAVAKGKLLDLATRQEQYFADNKVYSNTLDAFLALGTTDAGVDSRYNWVAPTSADAVYRIAVATAAVGGVANMAYTLTATPVNAQAADASKCATFTINQAAVRGATGGLGNECWE